MSEMPISGAVLKVIFDYLDQLELLVYGEQ